ncbi:MAG: histidine kinase N-terminal 7TM domain-containing protein [Clostridium sp.]|nr:histidine kinase N-terminal 7TM domain-containing protein [Clostridium sp.]
MLVKVNDYFSLVLLVSAFVLFYLGYYSLKKDKIYMALSILPVSIYEIGYAFEILHGSLEWVKFWIKVEYIGIAFLPVAWLMFALNFAGYKDKLKKRTLMLLYIVPVIVLIINYTNDFHHLFYIKLYMKSNGIFQIVDMIKGPWYWVNVIYAYTLMFIGLIILILDYFKSVSIVKKQILFLIIAWIIPWVADIIYMFRLVPFGLDLCPLAFSFSGIISSIAILNFKLIKLTPIALEKVFYNMLDGVIILDSEDNAVNFNNSAKNIIPELKNTKLGDKKVDDVLKRYKEILKNVDRDSFNENLVTIKNNNQLRYYKVNINNIHEKNGRFIGKVIILNDVTEIQLHQKRVSDNLKFLQTLMDAIPNPIYSKDDNGAYNHCNSAFTEYLGMKREKIIGKTVNEVFEKDLAEIYNKSDKYLKEKKGTQVYESKLIYKDSTYHDVIFNKSIVENEQGDNKGLVGVIIDITEQKKNEEKINKLLKLKESMIKIGYSINEKSNIEDLLQLILDEVISCIDDKSCGSILLLDKDKNLKIIASKGYKEDQIKTFSVNLKEHFEWFNSGKKIRETVILNSIDKYNDINMLDTKDGIKIKSSISSPIIVSGELYGFLNIDSIYDNIFNERDLELMEYMRNQTSLAITKHKLYEETLYLSRYDKLTNVYNRSYFEQLIRDDIYKNVEEKKFIVAIFDLNGLKFVNDNYGHLIGDELIKTFSKGLMSLAVTSDTIGRFGGDEFVGIFFNVEPEILINRFEELIKHFKNNPTIFEKTKIVCSFSYGIANFPEEGMQFNEMIKIADKRMYEYKRRVKSKNKNN